MVSEITNNNWLKWGFDGIYDFSFRTHAEQKYTLSIEKCSRTITNFKNESLNCARMIYEKAQEKNQDVWISYSGGIDSEFVARTFIEANIPFKIATTVFKNGHNDYDVFYSRQFCQKYDLKLYEFNLDIEKFLENEMWDYAKNTSCASPMFPSHFKLWDSLDGFIVGGHGDMVFKRTYYTNDWNFRVKENEDSVYRYFVWKNRQSAPGFFAYTPEMFLSFIWEEEISRLFLFGHRSKVSGSVGAKERVYNKYYIMDNRIKQHGFEKINNIDLYYRTELEKMIPGNNTVYIPIQTLLKSLWPTSMTGQEGGNIAIPDVS
jgi:hypothetical protein